MDLPFHDSIQQTVPDVMHTINDAIVNLYDLITGKDDTISCRQCGRFGITRLEKIIQEFLSDCHHLRSNKQI